MKKLCALGVLFFVAACSSGKPKPPVINYTEEDRRFIKQYHDVAAQAGVKNVKLGSAYQIKDEWYFPAHQPSYSEEGMASWYGPGFAGRPTANGEIFDPNDFTAAHPSLPIPSIVEVTNLDNGRSINVRINDRGPFHSKRIIDVSKAAAVELGMISSGTAKVSVRLLPRETLEYLQYAGK